MVHPRDIQVLWVRFFIGLLFIRENKMRIDYNAELDRDAELARLYKEDKWQFDEAVESDMEEMDDENYSFTHFKRIGAVTRKPLIIC